MCNKKPICPENNSVAVSILVFFSIIFVSSILSCFLAAAQVRYSGTINYSPPNGQDGCKYTIHVGIAMTMLIGSNGMGIDYDISIASFTGLIIDGKNNH